MIAIRNRIVQGIVYGAVTAALLGVGLRGTSYAQWNDSIAGQITTNDNVGIGTTAPTAKLNVNGADLIGGDFAVSKSTNQQLKSFSIDFTDNVSGATTSGQGLWVKTTHNTGASFSSYWASLRGAVFQLYMQGSNTMTTSGAAVLSNVLNFASSGNYNFYDVTSNTSVIIATSADSGTRTITNLSVYKGLINLENSSGTWNVENASIFYAPAMVPQNYGTVANTAGVVVEKQTIGTNNVGIWLNGDGLGADIALGLDKDAKIYYDGTDLVIDPDAYGSGELHVTGNINVDGNIAAKYQDLAEWVMASEPLTSGTVVMIDAEKIDHVTPSDKAYNTLVAGVVSQAPGILLGEQGDNKAVIAHTGRVKVKVDTNYGAISTGDLLVTSPVRGYAMKSEPLDIGGVEIHRPGTIIGKALEPLGEGQQGEVLALITLQ